MKILKFYSALLTFTLCLTVLSPAIITAKQLPNEVAAEKDTNTELVKARKADLDALLKNLESQHPNMYNTNAKSVFNKKKASIQSKLKDMSDFEFAIAVSELTALVGDSHTKANISSVLGETAHYLPIRVTPVKEGLMIRTISGEHKEVLGGILTSINGFSMDEIKQKISPMLSHDNEVYLEGQFEGVLYVYEILEHYGILNSLEDISLEVKVGDQIKTIKMNAVDSEMTGKIKLARIDRPTPETAKDQSKLYFFKPLDDKTLYIQYNSCFEDEKLPMKTFAEQVNEALTQKGYKNVVVDLRYNGGGSDGVIIPLIRMLAEKYEQGSIKLYTLIGTDTFSSAIINAVMFKEVGSVMVGTPTGGSVNHYGAISNFELPNSKISIRCSNKFCDLTPILEAAKPYGIEPLPADIVAQETREDYLLGKDTAVEAILSDSSK